LLFLTKANREVLDKYISGGVKHGDIFILNQHEHFYLVHVHYMNCEIRVKQRICCVDLSAIYVDTKQGQLCENTVHNNMYLSVHVCLHEPCVLKLRHAGAYF